MPPLFRDCLRGVENIDVSTKDSNHDKSRASLPRSLRLPLRELQNHNQCTDVADDRKTRPNRRWAADIDFSLGVSEAEGMRGQPSPKASSLIPLRHSSLTQLNPAASRLQIASNSEASSKWMVNLNSNRHSRSSFDKLAVNLLQDEFSFVDHCDCVDDPGCCVSVSTLTTAATDAQSSQTECSIELPDKQPVSVVSAVIPDRRFESQLLSRLSSTVGDCSTSGSWIEDIRLRPSVPTKDSEIRHDIDHGLKHESKDHPKASSSTCLGKEHGLFRDDILYPAGSKKWAEQRESRLHRLRQLRAELCGKTSEELAKVDHVAIQERLSPRNSLRDRSISASSAPSATHSGGVANPGSAEPNVVASFGRSKGPSFYQRGEAWLAKKKQRANELRSQAALSEVSECTFRPATLKSPRASNAALVALAGSSQAMTPQRARELFERHLCWKQRLDDDAERQRRMRHEAAERELLDLRRRSVSPGGSISRRGRGRSSAESSGTRGVSVERASSHEPVGRRGLSPRAAGRRVNPDAVFAEFHARNRTWQLAREERLSEREKELAQEEPLARCRHLSLGQTKPQRTRSCARSQEAIGFPDDGVMKPFVSGQRGIAPGGTLRTPTPPGVGDTAQVASKSLGCQLAAPASKGPRPAFSELGRPVRVLLAPQLQPFFAPLAPGDRSAHCAPCVNRVNPFATEAQASQPPEKTFMLPSTVATSSVFALPSCRRPPSPCPPSPVSAVSPSAASSMATVVESAHPRLETFALALDAAQSSSMLSASNQSHQQRLPSGSSLMCAQSGSGVVDEERDELIGHLLTLHRGIRASQTRDAICGELGLCTKLSVST